ncbi:hypothetical protein WH7805_11868 [Synechococcus sp. WH 7805]|nr:hypothetical protein WH7805_11868 [Synechococcus sp. WH 7805]
MGCRPWAGVRFPGCGLSTSNGQKTPARTTMSPSVRETLSTPDMAKALGISQKLLLKLRHLEPSPFKAGEHYRFQGMTTAAPLRWFPAETDTAFTTFSRVDPSDIETMDGGEA